MGHLDNLLSFTMPSGTNSGGDYTKSTGGTDYSYKNKKGSEYDKKGNQEHYSVPSDKSSDRQVQFFTQSYRDINTDRATHSYMTKETNTQGVGYWRESSKGGRDFEFHNFHGSEFTQSGDHQHCSEPGDCHGWHHHINMGSYSSGQQYRDTNTRQERANRRRDNQK